MFKKLIIALVLSSCGTTPILAQTPDTLVVVNSKMVDSLYLSLQMRTTQWVGCIDGHIKGDTLFVRWALPPNKETRTEQGVMIVCDNNSLGLVRPDYACKFTEQELNGFLELEKSLVRVLWCGNKTRAITKIITRKKEGTSE